MSARDDYPQLEAIARYQYSDHARALDEIDRLRQWKAEASLLLGEYERAWDAAGRPGRLGASKAKAVAAEVNRLRSECAAWMNGVADAVEWLGYDREAACGPADLLPGLQDLAERARAS